MPQNLSDPTPDPAAELNREKALVERAHADLSEFKALYERYFDRIYNYCYYRTFDREIAEDLAGKIFMKAVEAFPRYEWKGLPFGAWLFRIAANQLKNHYRDTKVVVDIEQIAPADAAVDMPVLEHLEVEQEQQVVTRALLALGEKCREAIVLRFYEELAYQEIAARLRKSEAACKMQVKRCLETMKSDLLRALPDFAG